MAGPQAREQGGACPALWPAPSPCQQAAFSLRGQFVALGCLGTFSEAPEAPCEPGCSIG